MIIIKNKIIKSNKDFLIDFFAEEKKTPLIIFSHGFNGFKDWGLFNEIAKYFVKNGFSFAKYNFSHNGTTVNNPIEFKDLDSFGKNNYSKELDDLGLVIDYITSKREFKDFINPSKIYLIGHSRGGGVSILKAAEDIRVKKIITWSSPADFSTRFTTDLKRWKKENVVYVLNGRTKQKMPLYYQFYEDFIKNKKRLDIPNAVKKINFPFLIIHGKDDEAVSVNDAQTLNELNKNSVFEEVENAGHTFNVTHPPKNLMFPTELKKVLNLSINFLKS